ncbi:MAG: hypothetical protein ACREV3_11325 [Gammaproteobacteria bacterium]
MTWDVEISPASPNLVVATSFYDGRVTSRAGINVSSDGGNTWTRPATAMPPVGFCRTNARRDEPSAFGISFDPDNPQNVYVGTNCGLAISNDSGANWRLVDPTPANGANDVWDVIVHHAGIIDTCGDDGHRRSTDGGNTWISAAATGTPLPAGICSIAVSPDESYVLFATVGTSIFESDDGGGTWNTTFVNPSAQGRIPFVAVNDRAARNFDLWFGDVRLHRANCTTPATPAPGGAARCPQSNTWAGPFTRSAGAHDDAGAIVFDTQPPTRTVIDAACSQSCGQQQHECIAEGVSPRLCFAAHRRCLAACPRQTFRSDACPILFSSDGGVYFNTKGTDPDCHTPLWEQPDVTPRSLWLFGMSGANRTGASNEGLFFGNQDTGTFASSSAGSAAPSWTNVDCCDGFDSSADTTRVLYTVCCFGGRANRLFVRDANMAGGAELNNYPAGNLPGFTAVDILDQFGSGQYVLATSAGVFITTNVAANPVSWTPLGTAPAGVCGVKVSLSGTTPTFIAQVGGCSGSGQDQLWRYLGTTSTGNWQQINPPGGVGGFGIFDIDPTNPNRILASAITATNVQMVLSNNGGTTWTNLTALDTLMTGNAAYRYRNTRGPTNFTGFGAYAQPTLVAFATYDANTLVAGAADAGLFVSEDSGNTWRTITDNSGPPNNSHIPRPQFAYFDGEEFDIYVGTQGRGVWRINTDSPPIGSLLGAEGKVTLLRVHDVGTGFGPPTDFIDVEVVITLDSQPGKAFGFQLRTDANRDARRDMLNLLRDAFNQDRRVRIDYFRTGVRNGRIIRVVPIP